jgi:surface polysaccharide O-acyltransferase-like enzyme
MACFDSNMKKKVFSYASNRAVGKICTGKKTYSFCDHMVVILTSKVTVACLPLFFMIILAVDPLTNTGKIEWSAICVIFWGNEIRSN